MNKYLIVCVFLFLTSLSFMSIAQEVSCANGQGVLLKGVNGQKYCRSRVSMNWWSANAWCESVVGVSSLVDTNDDCDCSGIAGCDTTVPCPNLKVTAYDVHMWFLNTPRSGVAYAGNTRTGELLEMGFTTKRYVVCR